MSTGKFSVHETGVSTAPGSEQKSSGGGNALDILMITHNRPAHTALALERLLETCTPAMRVWLWHNSEHAETRAVVSSYRSHARVAELRVSVENKKLREPTNWFWRESKAPFLSKVDDDCLLPDGWAATLIQAHNHAPKLGIVGCWRFYDEDLVWPLAARKMRELPGGHRIMANCWVQGSGYVMKRGVVEQLGELRRDESFTQYGIRAALAGWTNGWYFPFIHEEHMDDPRSPYCELKTDDDFQQHKPLSAISDNVNSLEEWASRVRWMARSVQAASDNPRYYVGWRAQLRKGIQRIKRMGGWHEPWRVPLRRARRS